MSHYEKYGKKYYENNREKELERARASYEVNKERKREQYLVRRSSILYQRYGITEEDYSRMLVEQGGCCAICGTTQPGGKNRVFHVDHCHTSKEVRGLLCVSCNHGLGSFKDNVLFLERAIEYVKNKGAGGVCGV